jgi:hypothetical protein
MIPTKKIEAQYPGLVKEMRFYSSDCLLNQGSLSGLQKALSEDNAYIDEHYVREKIEATIKTLRGLEHDLNICIAIGNDEFEPFKSKRN